MPLPQPVSAIALACLLLFAPQDRRGEGQEPFAWSGIEGWVALLHQSRVLLHNERELQSIRNPEKTWVILFGEAPSRPGHIAKIDRLIQGGAPVLIASDRPSMAPWFKRYGVTLVPGPITVRDKELAFQGALDCPVALVRFHSIFQDVRRIAFNRPAGFQSSPPHTIAHLPLDPTGWSYGCIWERRDLRPGPPVILISDHSVFINLMMMEEGNVRFATNLIKHFNSMDAVFFHDGVLVDADLYAPDWPDAPDAAGALAMLGPALRAIETSGMMQEFAARNAALSIGLLTITLLAIGALAVMRARSQSVPELERPGSILPDFTSGIDAAAPGRRDYGLAAQELLRVTWRQWRRERDLPSIEAFAEGRFSFEPGTPLLNQWIWGFQLRRLAALTLHPRRRFSPSKFKKLSARLRDFPALRRVR